MSVMSSAASLHGGAENLLARLYEKSKCFQSALLKHPRQPSSGLDQTIGDCKRVCSDRASEDHDKSCCPCCERDSNIQWLECRVPHLTGLFDAGVSHLQYVMRYVHRLFVDISLLWWQSCEALRRTQGCLTDITFPRQERKSWPVALSVSATWRNGVERFLKPALVGGYWPGTPFYAIEVHQETWSLRLACCR